MRLLILVCIFSLVSLSDIASQNQIIGQIADKSTGEKLSYALIKYDGGQTISNKNGSFIIETKATEININISYLGYKSITKPIFFNKAFKDLGILFLEPDLKSLDEITITSGKYGKPIHEVTVSIETITPKFINKNNSTIFDELLEKIPGVNLIDGQVNIRGGSGYSYGAGARVLVLINNMPALQFDSALPNWENLPVETISKVEVMKGAGSSLYGSAAMNGIINILPIYAKKEPILKLKTLFKTYDSPKDLSKKWWSKSPYKLGYSGLYAKKFGKLDLVSSFYINHIEGYNKNTFSFYLRGTTKVDYHFNDRFTIGLNTNYNNGLGLNFLYWKNADSGAYQADTVAYTARDKQVLIIDPYISYFTKKGAQHKLQSRVYHVSNLISEDKYDISTSYYNEYQYHKEIKKYNLILTTGAVYTKSITNAELYGDTIFTATNIGIYLQAEKKLWNRLNLVAGARYEINNIKGPKIINGENISNKYINESKPIFRFGANYRLFNKTNIRGSWGQGFRYPTIAEKFSNAFEGSLVLLPNLDLKSETGYSAELGIRQRWKFFNIVGYSDISIFQSEYKDMIEFVLKFDKNIYFTSVNLANTIIKGVELTSGFSGKIKNVDLSFIGGYYYIDPKYKEFTDEIKRNSSVDYNILKYRYKETFKFDAEISYKNFSIGFGSSYNSFMEAVDKIFELNLKGLPLGVKQYRERNNKGQNIYRMRIGYKYRKIGLQLNIDNLFNEEYSVRPGLMEAPRSFTFSLSFSL